MSMLPVGFGASGDYTIEESLRFNASQSSYLSRTPASAGNRKTFTISFWMKRGASLSDNYLFEAYLDNANRSFIRFGSDSFIFAQTGTVNNLITTQVFRDPSAWYHFVLAVDTTQATSSNRIKLYVNGTQVTAFSTAAYPSQNADYQFSNSVAHYVARSGYNGGYGYFDGYITEVNFIDGDTPAYTTRIVNGVTQTVLTELGEFDADTGVWKPVKYTGAYGTNGFYLNFSDASTTTTLGYDYSGQSNNWLLNNFSLTGTAYCSMTDTPTPYAGGGNYAVLNPLDKYLSDGSITNGNLTLNGTSNWNACRGSLGMSSGKWYWETVHSVYNQSLCGIADKDWPPSTYYPGYSTTGYSAAYGNNALKYVDGVNTAYGATFTIGDVIGYALDMDAGTLTCYKNGVSQGEMVSGLTAYGTIFPAIAAANGAVINANFGQRPFAYTPPTGFLPLHTGNLPDSAIVDGSQYFDVVTYTGNGTTQSVTGLAFQPDFLWQKSRGFGDSHALIDSVRGGANSLYSNATVAENAYAADTATVTFDAGGFSFTEGGVLNNRASAPFVSWSWKANGTGVSNTDGSITSTVSANPTAGFSIVSFTTNNTAGATVGHSLGAVPAVIIVKYRNLTGTNWVVYHKNMSATPQNSYLNLNTTAGIGTSIDPWNNTAPTSSVITLGTIGVGQASSTNYGTYDSAAYCFAEVEGFSKFDKYLGNGLPDGPFVYLGFRPAFVIVKRTDSANWWNMYDAEREATNDGVNFNYLQAESSNAENNNGASLFPALDFLSNGFKLRYNGATQNASGGTYIYMAFAENPFKNSLAR